MPQQISQTSGALAANINAVIIGDEALTLRNFTTPNLADERSLVWADNPANFTIALNCAAACILTGTQLAAGIETQKTLIVVDNLQEALLKTATAFHKTVKRQSGIHPTASVASSAAIGDEAHVGAGVFIGANSKIGVGVVIHANAYIGEGCTVGDYTVLHPNTTLYDDVTVGKHCNLHAGCVIGAEGFGYVPTPAGLTPIPHLGTVIIGDGVDIGANSCIDRAKLGATTIGSGSKIDNLVHIGHNVNIGRSCIIVAQAGLAGTVNVGDGVMIAGQAGIADHITIGDGARIAAQAGVIGDVDAGQTVSGYPARPHRIKMRELGAIAGLPTALKRLKHLESTVHELLQKREHDE